MSSAEVGSSSMTNFGSSTMRARDRDALALAAGEFVRIAVAASPDRGRPRRAPSTTRASRSAADSDGSCTLQPLADDVADRHARAERAEGVLEDDLHVAAERPHLLEARPWMSLPRKTMRPFRRDQPHQREAERRLAGAGFADDAERLALAHGDVDAVDRLDVADGLAQKARAGSGTRP